MQVQEVPPRPLDPLATLDEDYARAVLHLAWARFEGANDRRLLFAMVELLPVEMPAPLEDGELSPVQDLGRRTPPFRSKPSPYK